jgi:hypothetical protein
MPAAALILYSIYITQEASPLREVPLLPSKENHVALAYAVAVAADGGNSNA